MTNALALSSIANQSGRLISKTTDKYRDVSTLRVLGVLAEFGWHPASAQQARVRRGSERDGYQKHMVRLRRTEDGRANGAAPEIILINAHDGGSSFKLICGLIEFACMNGLIVGEQFSRSVVRHIGYADDKVRTALTDVTQNFPKILAQREDYRQIDVTPSEAEVFAEAASNLRTNADAQKINPRSLLAVRHREQSAPTLWNTFNVVQENLIKGGVRQTNVETRSVRRSRPITNIREDVRLNAALWTLAEGMAKLKGGTA